jgi:hypothetical protein
MLLIKSCHVFKTTLPSFDQLLFPPRPMQAAEQTASLLAEMAAAVGGQFSSASAIKQYLKLIILPPSRAWRYQLNGKTGNTFTLNLLFELDHGHSFQGHVAPSETGNQHPHFALFAQVGTGLLDTALNRTESWQAFRDFPGLRLATVRNPYQRAVSGFRYLCRSHEVGDRRFLPERLRLMALTGFDFERDHGTVQGFDRFLRYIQDFADTFGADAVDPHWRSQALHIRPDLYRPDIVGRTEEMASFAAEVARRLGRPLVSDLAQLNCNPSTSGVQGDLLSSAHVRRRIEQIYADDFTLFEYSHMSGK